MVTFFHFLEWETGYSFGRFKIKLYALRFKLSALVGFKKLLTESSHHSLNQFIEFTS